MIAIGVWWGAALSLLPTNFLFSPRESTIETDCAAARRKKLLRWRFIASDLFFRRSIRRWFLSITLRRRLAWWIENNFARQWDWMEGKSRRRPPTGSAFSSLETRPKTASKRIVKARELFAESAEWWLLAWRERKTRIRWNEPNRTGNLNEKIMQMKFFPVRLRSCLTWTDSGDVRRGNEKCNE